MKKLLPVVFCIWAMLSSRAQDIHFSQFRNAPLFVNPAYAGDFPGRVRAVMNYRNQWVAAGAPFKTFAASFDMPVYRMKKKGSLLGGGLSFYSDRAGDINIRNNSIQLSASGVIMLSRRTKLGMGLQGGAGNHSADYSELLWGNQYTGTGQGYDPALPNNETGGTNSYWYPDFSAGVFYEYNNSEFSFSGREMFFINAGATVFHVNTPDWSFSNSTDKLFMKYLGHLNMRYDFKGTAWGVLPSLLFQMQGPHQELNLGMLVRYRLNQATKITGFKSENAVYFGAYYRHKDAVIPQFFFEMADYSIGISYDVNISSYRSASNMRGGFEISLKYNNLTDAVFKRESFN
ncbi:MAG: PorP/SprF family type IX secretion system membrane protein [Bacteroidia bacterium]|nr:PorP/SprF family type IX secretion system membrane protein [Bacteroidia bacterium]